LICEGKHLEGCSTHYNFDHHQRLMYEGKQSEGSSSPYNFDHHQRLICEGKHLEGSSTPLDYNFDRHQRLMYEGKQSEGSSSPLDYNFDHHQRLMNEGKHLEGCSSPFAYNFDHHQRLMNEGKQSEGSSTPLDYNFDHHQRLICEEVKAPPAELDTQQQSHNVSGVENDGGGGLMAITMAVIDHALCYNNRWEVGQFVLRMEELGYCIDKALYDCFATKQFDNKYIIEGTAIKHRKKPPDKAKL